MMKTFRQKKERYIQNISKKKFLKIFHEITLQNLRMDQK